MEKEIRLLDSLHDTTLVLVEDQKVGIIDNTGKFIRASFFEDLDQDIKDRVIVRIHPLQSERIRKTREKKEMNIS